MRPLCAAFGCWQMRPVSFLILPLPPTDVPCLSTGAVYLPSYCLIICVPFLPPNELSAPHPFSPPSQLPIVSPLAVDTQSGILAETEGT